MGKPVEVDITSDQLWIAGKPLGLRNRDAVLIDHAVTVPGEIRCGLPEARSAVKISAEAAPRLTGHQQSPIVCFAYRGIGGLLVDEQGCVDQRGTG